MYQLCFYVPEDAVEEVKFAMFAAGAGQIGHYQQCSWQTLGQGQFMPMTQAHPVIGEIDKLEHVSEYKVEMVCEKHAVQKAVEALIETHPYEEPAYHIIAMKTVDEI